MLILFYSSEPLPSDCKDLQNKGVTKSGVYTIFPQDVYLCISLRVYCDMETDGGGWTVQKILVLRKKKKKV